MTNHCIKSVPTADLELVAFAHVFKFEDPQSEKVGLSTEVELEIFNESLRDSATFDRANGGWRCDCCGHALLYACEVVHKPTLTGYFVGRDCATKLESFANSNFNHLSVAAAERAKSRQRVASWKTRNPQHREVIEWALTDKNAHHIARDIAAKVARYSNISDKQIELVYRLRQQQIDRAAAKAAEPQPTTPAPEGRVEVTGTVLTVKVQDTAFGTTTKALIRLTDANKVWVTKPAGADFERGWTVTLRASWIRSDKDQHFAFGSRPHLVSELAPEQPAAQVA